ncbi:MAG TPA: sugar phosphate nucleotidyltransferase [Bacteroidota bacterium]|nr:sugar phosphate nucleotidyltransferase [Bacteroidota bacterium]
MKAVIMAGGFGTRLRPLTSNIPKPMVPMVNKPMMEHIIELLKAHGITDIVSALFYQPNVITTYFGDGSAWGMNMHYRKAEADYGTAGSVRFSKEFLDERFIVISGDVLTDFDLTAAIKFHEQKKATATLLLTRVSNPLQYGVVLTREDGTITRFLEKPSWGEVFSDTINTGIYILEPEVLELIPDKQEFDFSKNLFPLLLERNLGLYGYIAEGYWKDIGSLNEYQDAHSDALHGEVILKIQGEKRENLTVGKGSIVEADPRHLTGTIVIGKNCRVHQGAVISNSVIGDGCEILPGAVVRNSIIWSWTTIGTRTEISHDVIGNNCFIGDDTTILENVFISDSCTIGKGSKLFSNIKLWPEKKVEEGSIVTRSLVWEDKWLRELFTTDSRVSGISNVEITPEFSAKLGAAFGAFVGAGATVITSRDSDNVSRMINRAIMTGLMSAGIHCADLRASSIPIIRHELGSGQNRGGIHVRKSPFDKNLTDIIFFDAQGKDLPSSKSKSIERLFFGEDYARAHFDKVGTLSFPERTTERYTAHFLKTLDTQAIRAAGLKLVIDYSNGVASSIFPNILGDINVQVVALNAYLDNRKLTRTKQEFDDSLRQLSYVVTSLKYDLGIMLDVGAEKIYTVDEHGCIIDGDRLLTLMVKFAALANNELKKIAVPITASGEIDIIAKEFGLDVMRTRNSHLALMEAAIDKELRFVGGTRGGFIFNEFLSASDGMYSIAKLIEFMAKTDKKLGDLDHETIRLRLEKRKVQCPWHIKGRVMRKLMEDSENVPRELVEGVKLSPEHLGTNTTVLINPDHAKPVFHIIAESANAETAQQLVQEYEEKVKHWVTGK